MIRFSRCLTVAAAVAGLSLLGMASPARASIELVLTQTSGGGGTGTGTAVGNTDTFSGTVGDFAVTVSIATSNSPGSPSLAYTTGSAITITNNGANTETLQILSSANGFTSPSSPPPLNVTDTVSGSVTSGTIVSGNAQGFASLTNALGAETFASTKLVIATVPGGTSFSANGDVGGFNATSTYSLTFVENITLSAGGTVTVTGGNVETVVPAPAGLVLALAGLPVLGLGYLRRRRQAQVA